jgi:hypothetical protein
MDFTIDEDEMSLLIDVLAQAGSDGSLPDGLLPFFWRLTSAWKETLPEV